MATLEQNGVKKVTISDKDLANVKKLRELVKDQLTPYYDTEFNLLRWLQGHNNNIDEIVPRLRNHLAMRKSHFNLDTIVDGPRNHPVHFHWESGLTSYAELTPNCLVNVEQTGTNDYWGILHAFPLNEILWARVYDLERMLRLIMEKESQTGRQHSVMYIMDLSGLHYDSNLMTMLRGALRAISAFMSEHYVELIRSFVVVNAPNFISAIWTVAKPLLPEKTRQKVVILGASNWRRDILTMASPTALPVFWNEPGEKKLFLADLKRSKPVESSALHKPDPRVNLLTDYYTRLNVSPGKCSFVDIQAKQDHWLSWKFETDGHFSFGLYFVDRDESCIVVDKMELPKDVSSPNKWHVIYPRLNHVPGPTYVPMSGRLPCERDGTYRLWFSNEHAWLHVLKIRYRFRTHQNEEGEEEELEVNN